MSCKLYNKHTDFGKVKCNAVEPFIYLPKGSTKTIPLKMIYDFEENPGNPIKLEEDVSINVDITPDFPNNLIAKDIGLTGKETAYLTLTTTKGVISDSCPISFSNNPNDFGDITCADIPPEYKLYPGESFEIPINKIFKISGNVGTPNQLIEDDINKVILTPNLPDSIIAEEDGLGNKETSYISIKTNMGVLSNSCPVSFTTGDDIGAISCEETKPVNLLYIGKTLSVPLGDVFKFTNNPGEVIELTEDNDNRVSITPDLPNNMNVTPEEPILNYEDAYVSIRTEKNIKSPSCPASFTTNDTDFGKVKCNAVEPFIYLPKGSTKTIPIEMIYDFEENPGNPIKLEEDVSINVDITPDFPDNLIAKDIGLTGKETAYLTLTTVKGVISDSCPVSFSNNPNDFGSITCVPADETPKYLLANGPVSVNLDKIFVFDGITGSPNNILEDSVNNIKITPMLPDSFVAESDGLSGTTAAFISIETDAGIKSESCTVIFSTNKDEFGKIFCEAIPPSYLLQKDKVRHVELDDIFDYDDGVGPYGTVTHLEDITSNNILITPDLPDKMDIEYDAAPIDTTIEVQLRTNIGVWSDVCSANINNLNAKCDDSACDVCLTNKDYNCLDTNHCFDGKISVLNPNTTVHPPHFKPVLLGYEYSVDSFEAMDRLPPLVGTFEIAPNHGDYETRFDIIGSSVPTTDPNTKKGAGIMKLDIDGFDDTIRMCPELDRVNYKIAEGTYDPNSDLLITGSRAISGFYEESGVIKSKGPYIFTAKAWLRK